MKVLTKKTEENMKKFTKPVAQRCSVKKVFLEISQNSQERTCARVSFLINNIHRGFSVNFVKFLRTPFYIKTPQVTASVLLKPRYENQVADVV